MDTNRLITANTKLSKNNALISFKSSHWLTPNETISDFFHSIEFLQEKNSFEFERQIEINDVSNLDELYKSLNLSFKQANEVLDLEIKMTKSGREIILLRGGVNEKNFYCRIYKSASEKMIMIFSVSGYRNPESIYIHGIWKLNTND